WKNVYKLHDPEEFFRAYSETGELVMMLQEEVKFDMYFRCYSIDQRNVRVMPYEPRNPFHLRYRTEWHAPKEILQKVEEGVLRLNQYLGYDLNTVEFAIRDGVPVAIDFCNPAPDCEAQWIGEHNFEWVVEAVAEMAVRKAREHVPGRDNLSWGKFLQAAVTRRSLGDLARAPCHSERSEAGSKNPPVSPLGFATESLQPSHKATAWHATALGMTVRCF